MKQSGILLHPTSLPGPYGHGTLGKAAREFVGFLKQSNQTIWQVLPLVHPGFGGSPYEGLTAFGGNPYLIDPDELVAEGWLPAECLSSFLPSEPGVQLEPPTWFEGLWEAYRGFNEVALREDQLRFQSFVVENSFWLEDYALFMAIRENNDNKPWFAWPQALRLRREEAIQRFSSENRVSISFYRFVQFVFFRQWDAIHKLCLDNGIKVVGDIPLYVSYNSVDSWAYNELFQFDQDRRPVKVAGVPPDYFSETGQLWGNPVYNWPYHLQTNFDWWKKRVGAALRMSDIVRIDHFRGLAAYWAVPYGETTAIKGSWIDAPGTSLFEALLDHFGSLPIIAEDLGVITEDVEELRDAFALPGMKILQFGLDPSELSDHYPKNYKTDNLWCYTGTHDNNTALGWFQTSDQEIQEYVLELFKCEPSDVAWEMINLAMSSRAKVAIMQLQDLLGLGSEGRMNVPGTTLANWVWRYKENDLGTIDIGRLLKLTSLNKRNQ